MGNCQDKNGGGDESTATADNLVQRLSELLKRSPKPPERKPSPELQGMLEAVEGSSFNTAIGAEIDGLFSSTHR